MANILPLKLVSAGSGVGTLAEFAVADTLAVAMISGLGTAATANVTATFADPTVGRLLKVGDYGIGGNLLLYNGSIDDTTIVPFGAVYAQSGSTGTKPPTAPQGIITTTGYTNDTVHQEWTDVTGVGAVTQLQYCRDKFNTSAWGPWRRKYHSGNVLGAVSQTSGVPTGAIIETGSNANGTYTRYADGTMICIGALTTASVAANSNYNSAPTLPSGFANSLYSIVASGQPAITYDWRGVIGASASNPTTCSITVGNGASAAQQFYLTYIAIGRWFQ